MFNQETVDLLDDDIEEGSLDELCISQEVFYGNVSGFCNKRFDANGATNSATEGTTMVETSICSHSENSDVTNQTSSKNLCQEDADAVEFQWDSGTKSVTEGSISGAMIDHHVHSKRIRLSMSELSNFKPYLDTSVASSVPVKQIVSGMYHPTACQILMCHVVESCKQGMTSSCYLLKQYPESYKEGNLEDGNAPNGSLSGSDGSELKQVDVCKSVASPISQESSATKLLVSGPSVPSVGESGVLHHAKRRLKRDDSLEAEDDDIPLTGDSMTDYRPLLRSRVLYLLNSAGWSGETRLRSNGMYRQMYRSPEGRLIREFRKVWSLCGQSLCAQGNYQMAGDDKIWTDFDQFWYDLQDTFRYIEDKMGDWEPRYALACQWSLLNPFVILALVDRKIHALKSGNPIKVDQSKAVDLGSTHEVKCKFKSKLGERKRFVDRHDGKIICDSPLVSDTAFMNGDGGSKHGMENHKSRSINVSEENSLHLVKTMDDLESRSLGTYADKNIHNDSSQLPASVSHSTCLRYSSLYDVPIGNADTNMIYEQSETLSPLEDSCMSFPSCNKLKLDLFKENAKDNAGCSSVAENVGSSNKSATSFLKDLSDSQRFRYNKFHHYKYNNSFSLKEFNCSNETDEASLLQNDSIESQSWRKGMGPKKHFSSKRKSKSCQLKDDDLLISAIIKKRNFKSSKKKCDAKPRMLKLKPLKKRKSQKGSCRLLPRSLGKGGKHFTERWSLMSERTVLSWLISDGAIFINEVIQYRDPKDDVVVKDGLITMDGILCNCCNEVFSLSGFKVHSGFKQNRPCLNLFMGSGRPYTLCQLQAWSAEYKARKSSFRSVAVNEFDTNDDSCGLCGDGGELLCCDNCPSTFHQSCLLAEELPEGSWYCLNCTCRLCGDLANDKETTSSNVALMCSQCEQKYHQGCLVDKGMDGVGGSPWFCGIGCEEIYSGLQSRIGLSHQIGDDYSWTLLRCIQDDQKVPSPQRFALKAECNSKLAVGVTIMEECFLSMNDPRTGIDMIPQVVYNWGSEFARLDYHGFYTAVLEKNDVLVSVASIRVHGAAVAEMPLIATCSKYRRQGMCRRLLNSIEKMLISLKVEKLVITAISDLVETWTVGFGFIPVEEDEKRRLKKINLMVFPGTVMLKKTLYVNQETQDVSPTEKEPVDTHKNSEAATKIESEPPNDSGISKIETNDHQGLQISAIGQDVKLDNDLNQHLIEDQHNCLQVPKVQEAAEIVEELIEEKPESILSLQNNSGDQCLDHDVPILAKEEVSGTVTECVNDEKNQLSLIEQSQEASVLPQS